jgi:hypothetical protein
MAVRYVSITILYNWLFWYRGRFCRRFGGWLSNSHRTSAFGPRLPQVAVHLPVFVNIIIANWYGSFLLCGSCHWAEVPVLLTFSGF